MTSHKIFSSEVPLCTMCFLEASTETHIIIIVSWVAADVSLSSLESIRA